MTDKTILLVDDEMIIIKTIAAKIRDAGYTVLTAGNGQEALEVYHERKEEIVQ